jgi:hypothetical protein
MTAFSWLGSAVLVCAALPQAASAAGITYDCDTATQHFSELVLPAPGQAFSVTGNVQMRNMADIKKFAPLARVHISSATEPGQSPDLFAGFKLLALPLDKRKAPNGAEAVEMLSFTAKGKEDESMPMSVLRAPGTTQPFKLTYNGSEVVVTLDGEIRSYPFKMAEPVVRVICSTGEFLFTDLTVTPTP